jgi:hypothetical protein
MPHSKKIFTTAASGRFFAAVFLLCAMVVASSAQPPVEEIGFEALKAVNGNWQTITAKWTVNFHASRPGYLGLADMENHNIDIWIRNNETPQEIAVTLVHEYAHAFDDQYLNPELRAKWLAARGVPPETPWYPPCSGCSDFRFGAGDFAESVSWALQGSNSKFRSRLGTPPNVIQQALIYQWLSLSASEK